MDADNIGRSVVDKTLVARGSFTEQIGSTEHGSFVYLFNHELSGWQNKAYRAVSKDANVSTTSSTGIFMNSDTFGARKAIDLPKDSGRHFLPRIDFTATSDGLAIVEFCAFVQWSPHITNFNFDYASEMPDEQSDGPDAESWGYYRKSSRHFKLKSGYVQCSLWRLTMNGFSIAESGPLGNEYKAHPIYLCGCAPFIKGKNNLIQLEAKFVWYAPGADNMIECSSWFPLVDDISGNDNTWSRDCTLNSHVLVATLRKR